MSLDSLNKRSQPRNGNMTRNIVGQAHEIAKAIHDGNLHGGGILEGRARRTIPHIVVLAVVVRANTDGESVATQILDLEAMAAQGGQCSFRVFHAYSISYWGSGVYSEDGFIFIHKVLFGPYLGSRSRPRNAICKKKPRDLPRGSEKVLKPILVIFGGLIP